MEIAVTTIPSTTVVALRHIGPYENIGDKKPQHERWASEHSVEIKSVLGLWHDDPSRVAQAELRSDACMEVDADYVLPDENPLGLTVLIIEGGEYAVTTFLGSYAGLGAAWGEFCGSGIAALGRQIGEFPTFEVYVNDCNAVPVEEVRTDLYAKLLSE